MRKNQTPNSQQECQGENVKEEELNITNITTYFNAVYRNIIQPHMQNLAALKTLHGFEAMYLVASGLEYWISVHTRAVALWPRFTVEQVTGLDRNLWEMTRERREKEKKTKKESEEGVRKRKEERQEMEEQSRERVEEGIRWAWRTGRPLNGAKVRRRREQSRDEEEMNPLTSQ